MTELDQHKTTSIRISKTKELSGGTNVRNITIENEKGEDTVITVFGATEEDLEVEIQ